MSSPNLPHIPDELLLNIFQSLPRSRDLLSVVQTQQSWRKIALVLYWRIIERDSRAFEYLTTLINDPNQQVYADMIEELTLDVDSSDAYPLPNTTGLTFPRLKKLSIQIDSSWVTGVEIPVGQFLQPELTRLSISSSNMGVGSVGNFLANCPTLGRLERLDLRAPIPDATPVDFVRLLGACNSLETITMDSDVQHLLDDQSFAALARHQRLKWVAFSLRIDDAWVNHMHAVVTQPFAQVRQLWIRMSGTSANQLLPHLTSLRFLKLQVTDRNDFYTGITAISGHLRGLELILPQSAEVDVNDMAALCSSHLERLKIKPRSGLYNQIRWNLDEHDIDWFFSGVPNLKHVEMGFMFARSDKNRPCEPEEILRMLGRHCPNLQTIVLDKCWSNEICLADLDGPNLATQIMFRDLRELTIGSVDLPGPSARVDEDFADISNW